VNSVDRLDRFFLNLKVTLAEKLAPAFEYVTVSMENWQKRSQGIVDRFAEIRKEAGWWAAWKDKEGFQKYEFAERGSVQGANIPSIMSGIGGMAAPKKDVRDVVKAKIKKRKLKQKKLKKLYKDNKNFTKKKC
jgi:uncharacterized iron-regulated protein